LKPINGKDTISIKN